MPTERTRRQLLAALLLFALFAVTAAGLDLYGKRSRVIGASRGASPGGVRADQCLSAADAYRILKAEGHHGRVVVSLSRRLNFETTDESDFLAARGIDATAYPLGLFSLTEAIAETASSRNFLYVTMRSGIGREIIHVVPDEVFRDEILRRSPSRRGNARHVATDFMGSPRIITTLATLGPVQEPVLLYVDASYFRGEHPEKVMAGVVLSGLTSDRAIFCESSDDVQITDEERSRLREFARLWRGSHARP